MHSWKNLPYFKVTIFKAMRTAGEGQESMVNRFSLALFSAILCKKTEAEYVAHSNGEELIRRSMLLALLYLVPANAILLPVVFDPDIWWHLQTGKWIVNHGVLPQTDPFSTFGDGRPWMVYTWLFDVSMYGLVSVLGEGGLGWYTLTVTWLIMLVLHRMIATRYQEFVIVCGVLALTVLSLSKMLTPRPWLLTILFCALTLEVVLSVREGKTSRWFWYLPLVYVLWANTHIQFVFGLGLLGLALVAPIVDSCRQLSFQKPTLAAWEDPGWHKLLILSGLCGLATLATPYHVDLYSMVMLYAGQTQLWDVIQELQAPPFRFVGDWAMLVLFSLALIQLGRRARWSSFETTFIVVAAFSAFRGQREAWFLVLGCLAVLVSARLGQNTTVSSVNLAGVRIIPTLALLLIGVSCLLWYREFSHTKILENTAKHFPFRAIDFVKKQGYTGPLYNHFNWGGYLIWQLPDLKVSMDGRTNVHGDERVKKAVETWAGGPRWKDDPELNEARVVIAKRDMALASLLRLDPRFYVAYEDQVAVVFNRSEQRTEPILSPTFLSSTVAGMLTRTW